MTWANAQHVRLGGLGRAWRAFGAWRRSRPFWGGLLLLLAGLEIFASTQMSLGGLSFQFGPTGFLSWLVPVIIAACGLFAWFTPGQRMFYAVVGGVASVYSLVGVNLGGFFVGLLLGILGAGLVFAWVPAASPQPVAPPDPATVPFAMPDEGLDLVTRARYPATDDASTDPGASPGGSADASGPAEASAATDPLGPPIDGGRAAAEPAAGTRHAPGTRSADDAGADDAHRPASDEAASTPDDGGDGQSAVSSGSAEGDAAESVSGPRIADEAGERLPRRDAPPRLYSLVMLLALALTAAAAVVAHAPAPAWAAPCATAPVAPQTAAANTIAERPAPSPSPRASDQPGLVGSVVDGITGILDGANPTAVDPVATPTPTAPPPAPAPAPTPGASSTVEPSPSGSCVTAGPSASEKATPGPTATPLPRLDAAAGQPLIAKEPSLLTGSTLTMWDLKIAGVVDLPTHGGTLRALKFTMSRSTVDDFVLTVPRNGPPLMIKSSALTVRGDVAFYATRFVGWILGIKLTLTPDSPLPADGIPLSVPLIALDKPEVRLAFVQCDTLVAPGLDESFPNQG
ncbi:MAG TPA: DUF6114 domain-containing protein [Asanoa sp.]